MIVGEYGLHSIEDEGDKRKFLHYQDTDFAAKEAAYFRSITKNDGWTTNRNERWVGHIPAIYFKKYPEWEKNPSLILKWLETPEGSRYRIAKPNTKRDPRNIIK